MNDTTIKQLRDRGYRMTRQRTLILQTVRDHGDHLTAEAVYGAVAPHHPTIDLATVYRTLHWLAQVGLVRSITLGSNRIEWESADQQPHHHLVCRECGDVTQVDHHVLEGVSEHILHHYGFEAHAEHFAIFGRCADCRTHIPPQPGNAA